MRKRMRKNMAVAIETAQTFGVSEAAHRHGIRTSTLRRAMLSMGITPPIKKKEIQ